MSAYSSAGLVAQMRANGNQWVHKDVRVTLAQAYGYCWGVERAVQMAYEARKQFPDQKMHITNEIIHNPAVNQVAIKKAVCNPLRLISSYNSVPLTPITTH